MKDTFFQCIFMHAGIILLCESIYPFETVVDVNVLLTNALYCKPHTEFIAIQEILKVVHNSKNSLDRTSAGRMC